jgi:hypothetical protein
VAGEIKGYTVHEDRRRDEGRSFVLECMWTLLMYCTRLLIKALHAWTGPEGSRTLRLPNFKTVGT